MLETVRVLANTHRTYLSPSPILTEKSTRSVSNIFFSLFKMNSLLLTVVSLSFAQPLKCISNGIFRSFALFLPLVKSIHWILTQFFSDSVSNQHCTNFWMNFFCHFSCIFSSKLFFLSLKIFGDSSFWFIYISKFEYSVKRLLPDI